MSLEQPQFMAPGVFAWDGLGYHFASEPPADFDAAQALHSSNPWMVVAAVLDRVKKGDFSTISKLENCLREPVDWVLTHACAELLGDAGPSSVLQQVMHDFRGEMIDRNDTLYQRELAYSASHSGLLWTIPIVLDVYCYSANRSELDLLPALLSLVIESDFGPVASPRQADSVDTYHTLVMAQYERLRDKYGSSNVSLRYGEPVSVRKLARRLYDNLRAPKAPLRVVRQERHYFEAATGVDCRAFFVDGKLRALDAAAIVEEFLERDADKYRDGVRYFFGHPIPG